MTITISKCEGTEQALLWAAQEAVAAVELARRRRDLLRQVMEITAARERRYDATDEAKPATSCCCLVCGCQTNNSGAVANNFTPLAPGG